jgi:hypothetical protein
MLFPALNASSRIAVTLLHPLRDHGLWHVYPCSQSSLCWPIPLVSVGPLMKVTLRRLMEREILLMNARLTMRIGILILIQALIDLVEIRLLPMIRRMQITVLLNERTVVTLAPPYKVHHALMVAESVVEQLEMPSPSGKPRHLTRSFP